MISIIKAYVIEMKEWKGDYPTKFLFLPDDFCFTSLDYILVNTKSIHVDVCISKASQS